MRPLCSARGRSSSACTASCSRRARGNRRGHAWVRARMSSAHEQRSEPMGSPPHNCTETGLTAVRCRICSGTNWAHPRSSSPGIVLPLQHRYQDWSASPPGPGSPLATSALGLAFPLPRICTRTGRAQSPPHSRFVRLAHDRARVQGRRGLRRWTPRSSARLRGCTPTSSRRSGVGRCCRHGRWGVKGSTLWGFSCSAAPRGTPWVPFFRGLFSLFLFVWGIPRPLRILCGYLP